MSDVISEVSPVERIIHRNFTLVQTPEVQPREEGGEDNSDAANTAGPRRILPCPDQSS